jgi:hypothetical protein
MWLAAIFFGLPSLVFACWQYSATFHGNRWAAAMLSVSLLVIGGLLTVGAGGAVVELLASGIVPPRGYLILLVVPLVLFASWLFFTAVLTRRWRKRMAGAFAGTALDDDAIPPPLPPFDIFTQRDRWAGPPPIGWQVGFKRRWIARRQAFSRSTLWRSVGLVAALSLVAAGFDSGIRGILPRRQMHITAYESHLSLPEGATDVCILRGPRGSNTFDFAVDEASSRKWIESDLGSSELNADDPPIKPIVGSFEIFSCSEDPDTLIERRVINHGWHYSWRENFHYLKKAYDSDTGRAYWDSGY